MGGLLAKGQPWSQTLIAYQRKFGLSNFLLPSPSQLWIERISIQRYPREEVTISGSLVPHAAVHEGNFRAQLLTPLRKHRRQWQVEVALSAPAGAVVRKKVIARGGPRGSSMTWPHVITSSPGSLILSFNQFFV